MQEIVWIETQVPLKDLVEFKNNPRRITKKDFDDLVEDIKRDGYHNRIKVNLDNTIIGGDKRKKALSHAGFGPESLISVLKPNRHLTDDEFKRLNIQDNLHKGTFDFDILANNFEISDLIEWGMPENMFPDMEKLEPVINVKPTTQKTIKCPRCDYDF